MNELQGAAEWVIKGVLGLVFGVFSWGLKMLYAETKENKATIDSMEKDITNMKVDVASNYVNKQEFRQFRDEIKADFRELKVDIKEGFNRIEEKLDR